jgi:hypothetical protein
MTTIPAEMMPNHPINKVRLLMRKHDFDGPLPIVRVQGYRLNNPHEMLEIRAVIKGLPIEDVEARRQLVIEEWVTHPDEIPGLRVRHHEIYNFRYLAIQFSVEDSEMDLGSLSSLDPELAQNVVTLPGTSLGRPEKAPERPKVTPAGAIPLAGMPDDVKARVAALLESKKTATPEQARKIRQALRKLGHYISHQ